MGYIHTLVIIIDVVNVKEVPLGHSNGIVAYNYVSLFNTVCCYVFGFVQPDLTFMDTTSLKAIAEKANVSVSTVSRALSEVDEVKRKVKPSTLKHISAIAADAGYTPNAVARSLITNQTKNIGFIVTSAGDPFWSKMLETAEHELRQVGWNLFIGYSQNDPEREWEVISSFQKQRVDGIILSASQIDESSDRYDRLRRGRAKILIFDRQGKGTVDGFQYVGVDNERGGELATRHLIDQGHSRIAYVGLGDRPRSNQCRQKGYKKALKKAGIHLRDEWLFELNINNRPMEAGIELGRQNAGQIARKIQAGEITALFCFNDILAIGTLLGCRDLGVNFPEDCSIVGFDDLMVGEFTSPRITTVRQPREKMASNAVRMLLDRINIRDKRVKDYLSQFKFDYPGNWALMEPTLVVRDSTTTCKV